MSLPPVAHKVLTAPQMAQFLADGVFKGAPVDLADGYIHLSAEPQLAQTIDKHFAGMDDLFIATVDLGALGDAVKWEVSRGGALFPHVYADLPLTAVVAHGALVRAGDGSVVLPAA
ncbi:DUF952 domain-containing protein [Novosphingobium humi]|uniref:DUF952 domain-containing protein n=1 Tax=Novosphingobium humi TaxID=2282397 RepID=UPI0025B1AFF9|nr:DUF952 domain-containing protein [Novosphingobium humi]WJS97654.1 DUF952 domain-containing protein [Novosphingobium humi]